MIKQIFAFGSNFKNLNTILRSKYTFDYGKLQNVSKSISFNDYFIMNTCNRSEIYGIGNVADIEKIIFDSAEITENDKQHFFAYQGHKAVEHIFGVVCGLNSQIIGDNEISGQFKRAFYEAKQQAPINGFIEKMVNFGLQASREIKTHTALSNGTKSVSFAATKHISKLKLDKKSKILVVGSGATGKAVAKNIKEYIPEANLSLCNRTNEKAKQLANEINADYFLFEQLSEKVFDFEVIVSCVSIKDKPLFKNNFNWAKTNVHLIDLSVPSSVDPRLYHLPQMTIKNVDVISKELYETFIKRNEAVPIAKIIMEKHVAEFIGWSKVYGNKNAIKEWQKTFEKASYKCPFIKELTDGAKQKLIHKSTAALVEFIRKETETDTSNIIDLFKSDAIQNNTACSSANDCIKNKLNCNVCNTLN